jgi:hypothetical protein
VGERGWLQLLHSRRLGWLGPVLAVALVAGSIAWHAWRQPGPGPWLAPDLLAQARQANPGWQIRDRWVEVQGARGHPVKRQMLHLRPEPGAAELVLPADSVGDAVLRPGPCPVTLPASAGLARLQCVHLQPRGLAPRWLLAFQHPDPAALQADLATWQASGTPGGQWGRLEQVQEQLYLVWLPQAPVAGR